MKKLFIISGILLVIYFSVQSIQACSVLVTPLRKEFRRANSVFIGKVVNIIEFIPSEKEMQLIPEDLRSWKDWSKVTFEVEKKWKGSISKKQEFISVAWNICGCDTKPRELKEGEEFLVFSENKNFVSVCNSAEIKNEITKEKIKRIDNLGFKFWSTIYPF